MKILARSVLMLIALGFGAFGDALDSPNLSLDNLAVMVTDSDGDQDKIKCCSNPPDDVVLVGEYSSGRAASTHAFPPLLDTSAPARYQLLSVYRI